MNVSQFSADGALVSWDPSDCGADAVREAFSAAGFEKFAPKGRTEYEALKEAVGILKAKDQRVERHKSHEKNGCEILQVSRDASVNEYERRMGARVHVNDWDRKTVKLDSKITQYDQGRVDERFEQALCTTNPRFLVFLRKNCQAGQLWLRLGRAGVLVLPKVLPKPHSSAGRSLSWGAFS